MKKAFIPVLGLAIGFTLAGCGGNGEAQQQQTTDSVATVKPQGPIADSELKRDYSVSMGGHEYAIVVSRYPDKQVPTVKDQLDQEFYDNCVDVTITRDGSAFFSKTFKKEAFEDYLSAADRKGAVLLGMAYDDTKSGDGRICLAAQVGQPGMGEGPAFTVEIPTGGGPYSIVRDVQQDTTADEVKGE